MPGLFEELNKNNGQSTPAPQPSGSGGLFSQLSNSGSTNKKTSTTVGLPDNPFDTTMLEKSIENAKMRIENAGGNVNPDNRNGFEKFTNLPEGQNWLFDTFEIIGRPQQAMYQWLKGKLDKKPGAEITKDTIEGFKGKTPRVTGSQLLNEYAGVENKYGRGFGGFAVDVVSDPINLIPGAVFAKAAKGVGKGLSAGGKAVDKVTDLIPGVRGLKDNKLIPAVDATKDALGNIFKYQYGWNKTLTGGEDEALKNLYNQTENNIKYMSENSLRDVTDAARKAGGVKEGDEIGRIMEKDLKQFEEVKGYEFPDGIRRTENRQDLLDAANINRVQIKNIGKEERVIRGDYNRAISETVEKLGKTENQIRKMFDSELNRKMKTIQKGNPPANPVLRRGFVSPSPALNLLTQRGDEIKSQIGAVRKEMGLDKVRKKQYTPEQAQQLASNRAFKSLSNSPKFNYLLQHGKELKTELDDLRMKSQTARGDKINQIKNLVSGVDDLKEAAKNPVMIQKEFQRPNRYVPVDVSQAAAKLMNSNQVIRDWATSNNIPIGELEGYMSHILSKEEKALRKSKTGKQVDGGPGGINNPNKGILKGRELLGSAEDVNERVGRKFFETNAFFATAVGQKKLIDYGNAVKFRKDILSNPNFAKPHKKGQVAPPGTEVINLNNYTFTKAGEDALETIGGEYVVTKGVKAALDRYQKLSTDEGINAFLKSYDTGMGWWKRGALFSAGYHLRNDIGAKFNNYLAGMDTYELTKYSSQALKDVQNAMLRGKESELYNEFRKQGLSSTSQSAIEFAKHADDPEKAITTAVKNMSRSNTQKLVGGVVNPLRWFDSSQQVGNFVDQVNRFALFKWAIDVKKMTPEQAAAKVRETQFDYSRITRTEKEVFTRLAPFYRWSRNNIPFQLRKFAEDPARYSRVDKLRRNMQDSFGLEEQDTPDYMKQNFFMPVTSNGDGTGRMLGANLPVGDLTRLSNPGKLGLDSLTTVAKLPIELISNRNLFFNNDIKRFEGQEKKYQIPDSVYGIDIPGGGKEIGGLPVKLAYGLEQAGGQPARALSNMFGKPTQQDEENKALRPSLGISSLLKKYDINETNFRAKQKELRELMDLIDYLEQENGERPKSVTDIKKGR